MYMKEILEQRSSGGEEIIQETICLVTLSKRTRWDSDLETQMAIQDVSGKLRDDELMGAFYISFPLELPFLTHPQGTSSFSSSQGRK